MLPALTDMAVLYKIGEVDEKQAFLKGIFWGGFTKEKVGGRTKVLNPMFEPNIDNISHLLRVEKIGKPENFSGVLQK